MEKSSSTPTMPFKPLETLPSMLHAVMIQTANVFNSPNKQHARALIHTNALVRTSIPAVTDRFQYALDQLETDILKAKAVLTRDLNKRYHAAETAKQLAIEEEAAAIAREKAKEEEAELQRVKEEKDRLDAERLKKEQEEAEVERIRKEKEEQEAKQKAEQEQRERELQEDIERKAREEQERKAEEKREQERVAQLQAMKDAQDVIDADTALDEATVQNDESSFESNARDIGISKGLEEKIEAQTDDKMESLEPGNLSDINMEGIINLDDLGSGPDGLNATDGKNDPSDIGTSLDDSNTNDFLNFGDTSQLDNVDLFGEDPLDQGQIQHDADQQLNMAMNNNTDIDMDLLFGEMEEPQDAATNLDDALQTLSNVEGLQDASNDLMFDLGTDGKLDMMNLDLPTHLPNENLGENPEIGEAAVPIAEDNNDAESKVQAQLPTDGNTWGIENDHTFDELMQSLGDEDLNAGTNFDDLFGDIYSN